MFTYSYARKLLRDKWIELESKGCEVVYCDTDSLYFTNPNKVKISESRELEKHGLKNVGWMKEHSIVQRYMQ